MFKKNNILAAASLLCNVCVATSQNYLVESYKEPDDGIAADASQWNKLEGRLYATWAAKDFHCPRHEVPKVKTTKDTLVYAWRGERAAMKALLFAPKAINTLRIRTTDWISDDGSRIPAKNGEAHFMNYVLTDSFKACGNHPDNLKPYVVADVIDNVPYKKLEGRSVRPVWCIFEIPRDAKAGRYRLSLEIADSATSSIVARLPISLIVRNRTLPLPLQQTFHLDFWQQPYAVSRYYRVEKWSQAHFDAMQPYMERLARAGQSTATAILFYEPWGDQSHDKFDPMVGTTKKTDGTWAYDYTVFDRWVQFLDKCGINKQINCFSMVPWDMSFRYYDEQSRKHKSLKTTTSSLEYKELWTSFLKSFAAHLRQKGWFDKTCIAMDERGLDNMLDAYKIAQDAVPGMKMALAGNYHPELADKLYDYCIAIGQTFSPDTLKMRKKMGYVSTVYTCCSTPSPNLFSNSEPIEAAYLPIYCAAAGFDGYLHWSWMNWAENPLCDSRFRLFAPGDTYSVYPGNRSSVRFERFIEGIQAFEKINILKKEYEKEGNSVSLGLLDEALKAFSPDVLMDENDAVEAVNRIERLLNEVHAK